MLLTKLIHAIVAQISGKLSFRWIRLFGTFYVCAMQFLKHLMNELLNITVSYVLFQRCIFLIGPHTHLLRC